MKIQIFSGTFNPTSKTYVLDTDGTTPLALAVSNFIGNITPTFILQSQSGTTVPPVVITTLATSSTTTATPTIVPPALNLTISIFY
jgi:hypothetical protein